MPKTYCLDCDAPIQVTDPEEGDIITCPECGAEFEIISVDPLDIDYPLDEEWDEYEWEEEEEEEEED